MEHLHAPLNYELNFMSQITIMLQPRDWMNRILFQHAKGPVMNPNLSADIEKGHIRTLISAHGPSQT